jgi:hypothetical protein
MNAFQGDVVSQKLSNLKREMGMINFSHQNEVKFE